MEAFIVASENPENYKETIERKGINSLKEN